MIGRAVAANSQATACSNIVMGLESGRNMGAACNNVVIGTQAGCDVTGHCNVFLGYQAGTNVTSGCDNVILGTSAGLNATTACFNVFVGTDAGKTGTVTGNKNVALGYAASCNITSGNHNVTIGQNAGRDISTGCYNIFLGSCAGNTTNSGCYNIMIGCDVEGSAPGANCQLIIGHGANRWLTGDSSFNVTVSTASTFSNDGLNVTGVVTATSFEGDGSNLTGVSSPASNGEFFTGITSSLHISPLSFETTVHTFPSTSGRQYVIESISVANVDESVGLGTTVNIIASIEDATAAEQTYIAYNVPMVTGSMVELLKNPIVAGPSDAIKMWTTNDGYIGVNNAVDVYINYSEFESTDYISKFASTVSIASTSTTTLYTSTGNPTVIEKIGFANRTDIGDFPISIKITNGTSTSYLAKNLIIPRYSTVDILDRSKRIETGAKIEVEVGSTGTVDVIISGKKITS